MDEPVTGGSGGRCRSGHARLRAGFALGAVVLVFLFLSANAAFAADPPPATTLTPNIAVEPDTLDVQLALVDDAVADVPQAAKDMPYIGTVRPVLVNSGGLDGTVDLSISLASETPDCASSSVILQPPQVVVPRTSAQPQLVRLFFPDGCSGQNGRLILNVRGGSPTTTAVTIGQTLSQPALWWPVGLALATGIIFVAATIGKYGPKPVRTPASWSFKDSWLTTVSALGGVLVTILGATGLLGTLLPGLNSSYLSGLNFLFGGLVLAAPVMFSAGSNWSYVPGSKPEDPPVLTSTGTGYGTCLAAGLTIAGVVGQFSTIFVITLKSQVPFPPKMLVYIVLVAATLLVLIYAFRFIRGVTAAPPGTNAPQAATPGADPASQPAAPVSTKSGTM